MQSPPLRDTVMTRPHKGRNNAVPRFALHFAFAYNMSKIRRTDETVHEWKPEGLDLSAGPVPAFPLRMFYREQRSAAHATGLMRTSQSRTKRPSLFNSCLSCAGTRLSSRPTHSRKEVFQPHLPVRLPCYDLAPITSFALGRSSR